MPYCLRAVRASVVGLALAATAFSVLGQEFVEVREQVAAAADELRIPRSQVVYLGADGKPISEEAFYQALPANSGYTLTSTSTKKTGDNAVLNRLSEKLDPKPAKVKKVVVRLHGKPDSAAALAAAQACCTPEAARKSINASAKQQGIPREMITFEGADGAVISEQAFYAALPPVGPGSYHVTTTRKRAGLIWNREPALVARLISPAALAVGTNLPAGKPHCCRANEARKQIASVAKAFKVAPEAVAYKGVHGKTVSEAIFYEALSTMPELAWETSGSAAYSSAKSGTGRAVVARLRPKKPA